MHVLKRWQGEMSTQMAAVKNKRTSTDAQTWQGVLPARDCVGRMANKHTKRLARQKANKECTTLRCQRASLEPA